MATCPNCRKKVEPDAPQCPACNADFTAENGWKPLEKGQRWTGPVDRKPKRLTPYVPNWIPYETRMWTLAAVVVLVAFIVASLVFGKMYVPGGKRGGGMVFTGWALFFGVLAVVCLIMNLASTLFDHIDTRDNEDDYQFFGLVTKFAGWTLYVLALLSSCAPRKY